MVKSIPVSNCFILIFSLFKKPIIAKPVKLDTISTQTIPNAILAKSATATSVMFTVSKNNQIHYLILLKFFFHLLIIHKITKM